MQIPASGQGSAIIMRRCAHRYLDHWLLVSPLAYELPLEQGFYLIARTNSRRADEIRRFSAWLTSEAAVI